MAGEPNFVYVIEGTVTSGSPDGVSTVDAGKAFTIPMSGMPALSNEGKSELRVLLVDLHR